jgi:hypothetical protein
MWHDQDIAFGKTQHSPRATPDEEVRKGRAVSLTYHQKFGTHIRLAV